METSITPTSNASGQPISDLERAELIALDAKIRALLPPHYENCYDEVQPVSMGSAALKFDPDGKVAWDQVWTSFCHLALAGGPPHRGTLLEPVSADAIRKEPELYDAVVAEIARGIGLVTQLSVLPRVAPGWVGIQCANEVMATWLLRAVVAENVSARRDGEVLFVPAGPAFRLEKEIKNVITSVAKTYHYWTCHLPAGEWTDTTRKLLEPALGTEALAAPEAYEAVVRQLERGIQSATGVTMVPSPYHGWVAVECASPRMAVWLMRAMAVENILVRREGNLLFLPANPRFAIGNEIPIVSNAFASAHRLWRIDDGASR